MKRLLLMVFLAVLPAVASAEFYSYEDRDGTMHFVDDPAKIPGEYRQKRQVRKDKYDDLEESERALFLQRDREELERQRRADNEQQEQDRQRQVAAEKKAAREQQLALLTTRVVIVGRQVFVPVRLANGSEETEAMLLLDTGASISVITPEVAARLKIGDTDTARVGVVGGRVLRARKMVLSRMQVGPMLKSGQEVVVIRNGAGALGDGLLGMNFLAGLKYTLDFERQVINWLPN